MLPHTSAPKTGHKAPSSRDIPPVTLTNIPHVDTSAFKSYLSQVGSLYDNFQRAKLEAQKDHGKLSHTEKSSGKSDVLGLSKEEMASPVEIPQTRRRSSGALSKRHQATPLSTIPSVYFDDNFHLENPRTFDVVSERSEVVRPSVTPYDEPRVSNGLGFSNGSVPGDRKALATNAILQEKLSWYMDTVEVHLISSISTASTSFFAALGSLRDLQSEAADSVARIKQVREDLKSLDETMAQGGLRIINLKRRRDNLQKLTYATEQLNAVVQGVTRCEEIVEGGELELVLDRLDMVDELVAGNIELRRDEDIAWLQPYLPPQLTDLRELRALDGLSHGLQQLRFRVGNGFQARFLESLLSDLRQHVKDVPAKDTLQRWASAHQRARGEQNRAPSAFPAYLKTTNQFRVDLQAALNGLSRTKYTAQATSAFREATVREMKSLIRQHLPSSDDDDDAQSVASASTRSSINRSSKADKSSILARNLRALDPEAAEALLINVYTGIGEALRRLSTEVKVLLDVTSGAASPPSTSPRSPPRSPNFGSIDRQLSMKMSDPTSGPNRLQEELMQALDMSSLLGQAVDAAQTQITKVLRVRTDQTVRLPLPLFLRYFSLNRLFADECEAISGRSGAALKGAVNSQIMEFLPLYGESERQCLVATMDKDRWEAKNFGEVESAALSRILTSMTSNPPFWLRSVMIWEDAEPSIPNGTTTREGIKGEKEAPQQANVDDDYYLLVESALHALKGIDRLCNLIVTIPSMTSEVTTILLDYLKLFASRTNQLVLGTGATVSAGLKAINTRHLALSYQALRFMVAIIPYIREFVRRSSPSSAGTMMGEFDKVKRQYQEHGASIEEKLIDIMCMRASVHVRSMKKIEWDEDDLEVSAHIKTITNQTATLYRTLIKYVPEVISNGIMASVFDSYKDQWSKAFGEAVIKSEKGKQR